MTNLKSHCPDQTERENVKMASVIPSHCHAPLFWYFQKNLTRCSLEN